LFEFFFKVTKNYSTKSVSIYKNKEAITIAGKIKVTRGTKTDGSIEVIKVMKRAMPNFYLLINVKVALDGHK
jgi:hypothetical protein